MSVCLSNRKQNPSTQRRQDCQRNSLCFCLLVKSLLTTFIFHGILTKLTDTISTLIDLVLSPGHSYTRALRRLKRIKIAAMLNNLIG